MPQATEYLGRASQQNVLLQPAGTVTATGIGSQVDEMGEWLSLAFQLEVTATLTDATDTLDVFVQTTVDGTNWIDVVHFTQIAGDGGAKRYLAKIVTGNTQAAFENATALAASAVRNLSGNSYRVRWDIVSGNLPSFTFSVRANVQ